MICYSKMSADGENVILVVVNLDPFHAQIRIRDNRPGGSPSCPRRTTFELDDLLSGARYSLARRAQLCRAAPAGDAGARLPCVAARAARSRTGFGLDARLMDMNDQVGDAGLRTDASAAAAGLPAPAAPAFATQDPLWFKDAVIYQLHVKAFRDSNGDGIGDFPGLTESLDYIQDLGVNTIWILPFYPSPLRDDGYDIADYLGVHPEYGTRADFRHFLREAHRRSLRVITELVINHTSDQHPWFQAARRAPAGSAKRDFYVWSETPDRYAGTRIIFTDTEKSNWTWDPVAKAYFWHRFFGHQPDLNFDNPHVVRAVTRIMEFWLAHGVDGFRLDAIPYLVEREGTNNENLPETHAVLKRIRKVSSTRTTATSCFLAEVNQWPEDVRAYFGDGDECHMAFHFPLMPRMFMAIAEEDRHPIVEIMDQTPEFPDVCQWAIFLRNHDELTLEMVTSRERDYMYTTYAADMQARINLGIRRRLAPLMDNDPAQAHRAHEQPAAVAGRLADHLLRR